MKIFHAEGYVVRNNFPEKGDEKWERNSFFTEVFCSFEKAKDFLLKRFEKQLGHIYVNDRLFVGDSHEKIKQDYSNNRKNLPNSWLKEYIDEYIDYHLSINEINSETFKNWEDRQTKSKKFLVSDPQKIEYYIRYNGEIRTRYLHYNGMSYEHRPTDDLPEAGTKFKKGDLVVYTDWEYKYNYPYVYVVYDNHINRGKEAWENYCVLMTVGDTRSRENQFEDYIHLHEEDLKLYDGEKFDDNHPMTFLQKVARGEIEVSEKTWEDMVKGRIVMNINPSWRDVFKANTTRSKEQKNEKKKT